ncbi:hypothetical protein [Geomicrobium sp. JCM 19055]|uniref:hypothetical protein n=1 Tax=Geomicrobium sp. JCM 19055 TaxID=1460649 RepID=UPI002235D9C6|nr:hypothetical protein [Geomicrobium sp. JCM 19055]
MLLSGFVIFILILGPLTGSLAAFGIAESLKLNTPAYEQWRLLALGRYITRLDSLSIFQWFSAYSYEFRFSQSYSTNYSHLKRRRFP